MNSSFYAPIEERHQHFEVLRARFLAPLEKTRGFRKTPLRGRLGRHGKGGDRCLDVCTYCAYRNAASAGGVFRPGGHIGMKGKTTQNASVARTKGAANFKRLRAMRDSE